ncbi:unnamed protein product [Dovyalis caffra]|uniref:Uncharacterized protein n=1 Tax=Dovyalis caffra TaxID=77055 RepID=A0AAV1R0U8_9ROSI|nr:unnamed protein product [Dovyalis caffra]
MEIVRLDDGSEGGERGREENIIEEKNIEPMREEEKVREREKPEERVCGPSGHVVFPAAELLTSNHNINPPTYRTESISSAGRGQKDLR